jgi:hypothetical protein
MPKEPESFVVPATTAADDEPMAYFVVPATDEDGQVIPAPVYAEQHIDVLREEARTRGLDVPLTQKDPIVAALEADDGAQIPTAVDTQGE